MPPRLSVVVAQSNLRDSRRTDLEESLVAELIMSVGIDASLVRPLEQIQPDSTDHLCLSGLGQNFVLVSWNDLDQALATWRSLGFDKELIRFEEGSRGNTQVVQYLQLTETLRPSDVVARLQRVLESRRVQTFTIQVTPAKLSAPLVVPTAAVQPSIHHSPAPSHEVLPKLSPSPTDNSEPEWPELDELVDQLDSLDL